MAGRLKRATLVILLMTLAGCEAAPASNPNGEAAPPPASAAPVPGELPAIVARVNGESIERWEIESALKEIELLAVHPIPLAQRDALVRNVLNRTIGHYLVAQEARTQKLEVSPADVDADIAQIQKEYPDPEAFERMLAYFGISMDQLLRQRRLRLQVARFARANIGPIEIAREDVDVYYRQNLEQFQEPETVTASHILIRTSPAATPEEKSAVRATAAGLLDQLRRGADFARLARERSQDPATAAEGGALGELRRGEMDPAVEAAAFALEPGALSDLVESAFGYHIIRTHELHRARTRPLEEVRGDIEALLTERAQGVRMTAFVDRMKAAATIEIYI